MQYNNITDKNGILQDCERYCNLGTGGITDNTDRLYDFASYTNSTLRALWHVSFRLCGNWLYEDNNQTDLPQSTTDLVNGQSTYALPSGALTVRRVEMKDTAGNWTKLKPLSLKQISQGLGEFMKEDSQPMNYRLVGNTLELFPASNYDSTNGLKVFYDRGSVAFEYDDTTTIPGIASEYHDLIAVGASLKWLKIKVPNSAETAQVKEDYAIMEQNYKEYLANRFRDKTPVVARQQVSYK